jgi:acetyl esterase/lipase/lysophospholipase L1-like esterase
VLLAVRPGADALAAEPPPARVRVVLVGDSTMANFSGYGDALCRHFVPAVTCINAAKGGRSTLSYRQEGSWKHVLDSLASRDQFTATYVLIQFGHNDQPGKPGRSTSMDQFAENLAGYVKDVRAAGAVPLLVTPLTRRQFAGGKVSDNLEPWAETARRVAKDTGVGLLDLHRDSMNAVQSLGAKRSNELAPAPPPIDVMAAASQGNTIEIPKPPPHPTLLPPVPLPTFDYTHLGPRGADLFGAMVAGEIRRSVPPLAAYLSAKAPTASALLPLVINIWRGTTPGVDKVTVQPNVIERSTAPELHDRALTGITQPTLTIYKPAKPDGSTVLILPGGGYVRVVIDKEGEETARRLNQHGITAAVLAYRLPADGWAAGRDAPLQDAQRALRLLRSGIAGPLDPARMGVLGFSAGGDLSAALALRHDAALYERTDQADLASARPDFAALIYPAVNMTVAPADGAPALAAKVPLASLVTQATPPCFIIHAADDTSVPVERSLELFSAWKAAGVPAEMHIFADGGHGFGMRLAAGKPVEAWPSLLVRWGQQHRFFSTSERAALPAHRAGPALGAQAATQR